MKEADDGGKERRNLTRGRLGIWKRLGLYKVHKQKVRFKKRCGSRGRMDRLEIGGDIKRPAPQGRGTDNGRARSESLRLLNTRQESEDRLSASHPSRSIIPYTLTARSDGLATSMI